jgi:radical SAM protein with 4Fe4S-binding SPASM domain
VTIEEASVDWLRSHLVSKLDGQRWPLSGSIDLVTRCNFRCVHCYLAEARDTPDLVATDRMLALLDEMAAAGTLSLILTGGEPLLHPGFRDVFAHATRRGFVLALFTNASLVDDALARFLGDHPPRSIEVSLYGASPEAYARITGHAGHFARVVQGIRLLQREGLEVRLKSVLLAPLLGEVPRLRALARSLGLSIRFDPRVDPTLGGDPRPLGLRADPGAAIAVELGDATRIRRLAEAARSASCGSSLSCGAGHTSFHLDARGRLSPCMMVRDPSFDASVQGFASAWRDLGTGPRVAFDAASPCRACRVQYCCSFCPGQARLDDLTGHTQMSSECELAHMRHRVLEQILGEPTRLELRDGEPERGPRRGAG